MAFFQALKRRDQYETDPESGGYYEYPRYRQAIAEDCLFRCVYCDSHEDMIGGREAMEIDHFKPWGKKFKPEQEQKFSHLKHEPSNLVHSCGVCNGFKWSHWPTEDPSVCFDHEKGWVDPFELVRADFFAVEQDGTVSPIKAPAQFQISKLRLNRPLLKRQREFEILLTSFRALEINWKSIVASEPGTANAQTASQALTLFAAIQVLIKVR
jgi:5-methylcytosine-specific restriction endonuclease McrA